MQGSIDIQSARRPDWRSGMGGVAAAILLLFACAMAFPQGAQAQGGTEPDAVAQERPVGGNVPGSALGSSSDSEFWRFLKDGGFGTVSIPDRKAGQLIQPAGEDWRLWRVGPLVTYTAWAILGMAALLFLFFALRGRIRVTHGMSGRTITRFAMNERVSHWLLASSFLILGLTGLNLLYGRTTLLPLIGKDAFAAITLWGKYIHNYVAFAFMLGLALIFVQWLWHNFPNRHDIVWLLKGGGIFSSAHPPARKFNAGQKILFWLVIISGISVSVSGWVLLFPFTTHFFADTFATMNAWFGTELPTALTAVQEQQYAELWHTIVAVFMVVMILGHIYIGTIGMEGAISAMTTGEVDENWALEHHSVWAEEELSDEEHHRDPHGRGPARMQPAE